MTCNTTKALLIEDNPGDAELVRHALRESSGAVELEHADRLSVALALLEAGDFDVVLADLSLPDSHGVETVTSIRGQHPETPIVVLTSLAKDDVAIEALELGAQDYLVKDEVTPAILDRTIRYAIQREQNFAEIQHLLGEVRVKGELLEKKNRRLARLYKTAHRFVDNVSHEFRTPLTVIKEYVSLIAEGLLGEVNDEQRHYLDIAGDRADDLNNMVDDMLDVSRLEAGLLGAYRKTCRVAEIVEHLRSAMEKKALLKEVELDFAVDEGLPEVYCDPEKIGRVVTNLTVNAIKFCGQPGLVRVWARGDIESHDVLVGVTDNGPGIEEKACTEIFQRFKQLDTNLRQSTKGFGLGLNIAKELVDLNFGEMTVRSQLGRGSTFSFTIPKANPLEVMRRYLARIEHMKNGSSVVSPVVAEVDPSVETPIASEAEAFLNYLLRRNDLLFRVGSHRWLLVLAADAGEVAKFLERSQNDLAQANRNRPHGPLPPLNLHCERNFRLAVDSNELLDYTRHVLEIPEVCPA